MSLNGEDRLNDEDVEYNHRNESGDEESKNSCQAIEVIREIFTQKETGIKVNPQRNFFPSPAEEYFTPTKQSKNKRNHTFLQGAPARIEKRGENKLMLPFQQSITTGDKMAKALGLGGDNFILVQRPDEDGNYSSHKEIQEGKEVQYHAISPEDLLLPQIQPEPSVWMLGLTIFYMYTRNCTAANPEGRGKPIITKRDNTGKVKTPDMKLISPGVPVSSSDNAGYLHWRKVFAKFLHTNCMAAWHIWMTEEDKCPVSPTCQEFALYLDEQGYRDRFAGHSGILRSPRI